jgi:hypothetical protein
MRPLRGEHPMLLAILTGVCFAGAFAAIGYALIR